MFANISIAEFDPEIAQAISKSRIVAMSFCEPRSCYTLLSS